jgi:hypothetical protein
LKTLEVLGEAPAPTAIRPSIDDLEAHLAAKEGDR